MELASVTLVIPMKPVLASPEVPSEHLFATSRFSGPKIGHVTAVSLNNKQRDS